MNGEEQMRVCPSTLTFMPAKRKSGVCLAKADCFTNRLLLFRNEFVRLSISQA
jgi:hypothetical protein